MMAGGEASVMKPIHMLLMSLLIVLAAVLWLFAIPAGPVAAGLAHPEIEGMRVGGDGLLRFGAIWAPVLLLQVGSLFAIMSLIWLSFHPARQTRLLGGIMVVIASLSLLVWFEILGSYSAYLETCEVTYAFGFPLASAWTVYAVWGVGLLLSLLYVFGFDRFIYSAADKAAFEALLADEAARKDRV